MSYSHTKKTNSEVNIFQDYLILFGASVMQMSDNECVLNDNP